MNNIVAIVVFYNVDLDVFEKNYLSLHETCKFVIIDNSPECTDKEKLYSLPGFHDGGHHYVMNSSNIGLSAAQNIGIKLSFDLACDFIVFFDQDSILPSSSLFSMLSNFNKLIKEGINVGAVGPSCVDPNDGNKYPISVYYGPFIKRIFINHDELVESSFLIASGMLVSAECLRNVGFMNEDFFIDYIDIEWSFRASHLGYKLFADGSATMFHLIGDSRVKFFNRTISKHSALRRYYLLRNSILILRVKHISFGYKLREIFLSLFRFLAFFVYSNEKIKYLSLSRKAIYDAFKKNYGKIKD